MDMRRFTVEAIEAEVLAAYKAELLAQDEAALVAHAIRQGRKPPGKKKRRGAAREAFERSPEWRALSAEARRLQPWCSYCNEVDGLQADHIKPKSRFPELALDPSNVQVLCWPCNRKKAARVDE